MANGFVIAINYSLLPDLFTQRKQSKIFMQNLRLWA